MPAPTRETITGLILAGGQARRLGGTDKGLFSLAGRPLIEWSIAALAPQVGALMISANRNLDRYAEYGYPIVTDRLPGFQGPLAGFLAGMQSAVTPWILTLPCDGPQPPPDLGQRLAQALIARDGDLAVATDGRRLQSVYALMPVSLASDLEHCLLAGEREVARWQARHRVALADFSDDPGGFSNINSPDEARRWELALLERDGDASRLA